jgi:hypothetical protein
MKITGKVYDVLKVSRSGRVPRAGHGIFRPGWYLGPSLRAGGRGHDRRRGHVPRRGSSRSRPRYYAKSDEKFDGVIGVTETADKLTYVLNLNDDPELLKDKAEVRLKVGSSAGSLAA